MGRKRGIQPAPSSQLPSTVVVPPERIDRSILLIRGEKVMLDMHLAPLYRVTVGRLNEAVRRNLNRFPADFMFQLTAEEWGNLKSQIAISSSWGGRRTSPFAFTQEGIAMLSSVLHSDRAVLVNVEIMRAFVRLRQLLASNAELAKRLVEMEKKYDSQFRIVFDAIRQLMTPPDPPPKKGRIGFHVTEQGA